MSGGASIGVKWSSVRSWGRVLGGGSGLLLGDSRKGVRERRRGAGGMEVGREGRGWEQASGDGEPALQHPC